jgi:hypothetical protein
VMQLVNRRRGRQLHGHRWLLDLLMRNAFTIP